MRSTWDHPVLGRFKYNGESLLTIVDVPAFKAFAYDTGYSNAPRSTGKHELAFQADDAGDLPSPAAVALALKVLANQANLVVTVTHALWEDFNGLSPDSPMWWHGDLAQVAEMMGAEEPPSTPDDLLALLQLSQIRVRKDIEGHEEPVVELCFHAMFEQEHDVGILTDGVAVLGIGYGGDVSPFET